MDTTKLQKFAQRARVILLAQIESQLNIVLATDSLARRENKNAISSLEEKINSSSKIDVINQVSYIWFNRFCALRFMDVNRYNSVGIITPAFNETLPEILSDAISGHIDGDKVNEKTRKRVKDLLLGHVPSQDAQGEAYQLLLVAYCNSLNLSIPFLFGKIDDYVELLIPSNLLSTDSILSSCREAMDIDSCKDVEVIGWLYQYYISEKKDEVFKSFKNKKKAGPKEIPAATQLFTPHWIVKYLVENSLGRLWMLNNPDSSLIDTMEYYIKPEQKIDDFLKIQSPEEIKINDPACGSGHMLTYAFDILYYIYEEEGYNPKSIPNLILKNNLYGIEIDERAGELAAFALLMKARAKDRRFLDNPTKPNICTLKNISFHESEINDYKAIVGSDILTSDILFTLSQFEEADNFGSLIIPKATNIKETIEKLSSLNMDGDLFIQGIHETVLIALNQADYLSKKYHVVVANPPYMGGGNMNSRLSTWLKANYKDYKSDLFSSFIFRNTLMTLDKGQLGFMSPYVWMFISSYEKLREFIIDETTITSLIQLEYSGFDGATVPICTFTLENKFTKDNKGSYIRLSDFNGARNQAPKTLEAIKNPNCGWFYRVSANNFKKIPGSPIAYWVSDVIFNLFFINSSLSKIATPRAGMITGNNDTFLRLFFEISRNKIGFNHMSRADAKASYCKWFPYQKGGPFRKWYGNYEYLVNFENDGYLLRTKANSSGKIPAHAFNDNYIFNPNVNWSSVTSSNFSCRITEGGCLFDASGSAAFPKVDKLYYIAGFLNSKITRLLLGAINPTLNFQAWEIGNLPLNKENKNKLIESLIKKLKNYSMQDWNSYETSWDFKSLPLLDNEYKSNSISKTYDNVKFDWNEMTLEMQRLEKENNKIFIEAYGLEDEITPEVPLKEITLTCNPYYRYTNNKTTEELNVLLLADTMKEYISYAVGCMFGRYSIDKPGFVLANQGETYKDYCNLVPNSSFSADLDNVIPILDDEWFSDDIVYRFKNFVRITFGEERYYENIRFIEDSIGKDLRTYFLKDFYNDHTKRYSKRPIYWMFSSPNGGFNALIYMHRYKSDTVGIVRSNYLLEYIAKITTKIEHLERNQSNINLSNSEKTKALKEVTVLKRRLDELNKYERDIMFPLAAKKLEIDLDDGVKINYNKFEKALKNVTGLSGK